MFPFFSGLHSRMSENTTFSVFRVGRGGSKKCRFFPVDPTPGHCPVFPSSLTRPCGDLPPQSCQSSELADVSRDSFLREGWGVRNERRQTKLGRTPALGTGQSESLWWRPAVPFGPGKAAQAVHPPPPQTPCPSLSPHSRPCLQRLRVCWDALKLSPGRNRQKPGICVQGTRLPLNALEGRTCFLRRG